MRIRRVAALLILGFASSCAVRHESPNGIAIEVDSHQPAAAELAAREHCQKYGKKAVLVRATDPAPSPRLLYLSSRIMVFDCVAP